MDCPRRRTARSEYSRPPWPPRLSSNPLPQTIASTWPRVPTSPHWGHTWTTWGALEPQPGLTRSEPPLRRSSKSQRPWIQLSSRGFKSSVIESDIGANCTKGLTQNKFWRTTTWRTARARILHWILGLRELWCSSQPERWTSRWGGSTRRLWESCDGSWRLALISCSLLAFSRAS